ncbi:hypothetical protein EV207_11814 [Scopulibacillus darangshiensis]|uniref:DUF4031 domain-containing protein n=1 Tax=Scopulibacillus darangshiensis TaxID=442528 RepID=A0A4V2SME7_9BACL|nr:hypothetical protein [Scopulibacillus darangshiensis]TCP27036.1 hypothetical protein EV207_11814 [Scopulibacillus darangshiensis]
MAFGLRRKELEDWKHKVKNGQIAFLTHYWYDPRFPHEHTVTKIGCCDLEKLIHWGKKYDLKPEWIDKKKDYPHFDVLGERQRLILRNEGYGNHINRFHLE